jgi:hypothetical protein
LLWALPIHVTISIIVMTGAGLYYVWSVSEQGLWTRVGGWSLAALYALLGAAAGAAAGFLYAAAATVQHLEQALRSSLHALPALTGVDRGEAQPISHIRDQYGSLVERWMGKVLDRLWMPGWLDALIRSSVREATVDRFIASCEQRGLTMVGSHEFRNWLLAEGAGLGFLPVHNQLFWWRYLVVGLLGLLALLAVLLAYWA